jgi:hypothetical protein
VWATAENRRRVRTYRELYRPDGPAWRATREALESVGSQCRAGAVPLVVAVFPLFGNPLGEAYPFAHEHTLVAGAAGAAGGQVVDLLETYRGLRWEVLVVDGVDDEHPNEIAHRLAAAALRPVIEQLVPPAAPGAAEPVS